MIAPAAVVDAGLPVEFPWWKVAGLMALIGMNGFFVAAEFALVRLRETQLIPLMRVRNRRAESAGRLVRNVEACLSATQMGITLCGLGLGAMAAPVFEAVLAPVFGLLHMDSPAARRTLAIGFGFLVNTFLLIVVGELVPKALAIRRTLGTALWVAMPLEWFFKLAYPVIWTLNHAAQWVLGLVGVTAGPGQEDGHSEEEMRLLLAATQKRAGSTALGRDIVLNSLDLRRRVASEVMRPRNQITVLDTRSSLRECLSQVESTRYSRYPLCEGGDVDRMLGQVHIKDLFAMRDSAVSGAELGRVCRELVYVPGCARLEKVLGLLLERKVHMAVVVDEYGGTLGLVTLENIVEELVGQIQDEFDQEKPLVVQRDEQTWELDGALPLHELSELVGEPVSEPGVITVSGLVTQRLGGFPGVGQSIQVGAYDLRVEGIDGMRVARLALVRMREPA